MFSFIIIHLVMFIELTINHSYCYLFPKERGKRHDGWHKWGAGSLVFEESAPLTRDVIGNNWGE